MDDWESTCFSIGINGSCGLDCPVLIRGDCDVEDEMYEGIETPDDDHTNFDRAMEILK